MAGSSFKAFKSFYILALVDFQLWPEHVGVKLSSLDGTRPNTSLELNNLVFTELC